ncbi:MAG: hypothetical protein AAF318_09775 [Pseudomonadota bacterium]
MIRLCALLCALALSACAAPTVSGIAADVGVNFDKPRGPGIDPEKATFAFLPFEGVPGNAGDDLLSRIWKNAEEEGLTVVKRPGGRALFTVKGAITAVSDQTNSTVFYVFDVNDTAGRRLHRISGEQRSGDGDIDPWGGVAGRDLETVANRLAALLKAWLHADH